MEGGLVTLANIIAKLKCAALRPDLDLGDKTSKWSVRVEDNQMKLQHAARSSELGKERLHTEKLFTYL